MCTRSNKKMSAPSSVCSKELEEKFKLLNDFEIKRASIPNGFLLISDLKEILIFAQKNLHGKNLI